MTNYIKTRVDLARAMKSTPAHPKEGELQYEVGMELFGVLVSHITLSQMVHAGEVDESVGLLLGGTIINHNFCCLHATTHGSVSQHEEKNFKFEATVFRIAQIIGIQDDANREQHRQHHTFAQQEGKDPDYLISALPLNTLGLALTTLFGDAYGYPNLGPSPVPGRETLMKDQAIKMTRAMAMQFIAESNDEEMKKIGRTLAITLRGGINLSQFLLAFFFARYPHINAIDGRTNGLDSSYMDSTWRGDDQVDLWMNGEGWHVGHHAKTDVPYTVLGKVGQEVEEMYPNLKQSLRSPEIRTTLADFEFVKPKEELPGYVPENHPEPTLRSWNRCLEIREATKLLNEAPNSNDNCRAAISKMANAVFDSNCDIALNADLKYLQVLVKEMMFDDPNTNKWNHAPWYLKMVGSLTGAFREKYLHPVYGDIPSLQKNWSHTCFSDHVQNDLRAVMPKIQAQVNKNAEEIGLLFSKRRQSDHARNKKPFDIRHEFLYLFQAIVDKFFSLDIQKKLANIFAKKMKLTTNDIKFPEEFKGFHVEHIRSFVERPIPENLTQSERDTVIDCTKDELLQLIIKLFGGDYLKKDGTVVVPNVFARL